MNGILISYFLFATRAYIFVSGSLTYTLKHKRLQRKREEICKTVTSDNNENKWLLHISVRSIDLHF